MRLRKNTHYGVLQIFNLTASYQRKTIYTDPINYSTNVIIREFLSIKKFHNFS